MDIEKEFRIKLRKRKVAAWFSIFLFGACLLIALSEGRVFFIFLGVILVILSIYALILTYRLNAHPRIYRPGKGFRYYRADTQKKLRHITYGQWLALFFIAGSWMTGYGTYLGTVIAVLAIADSQFRIKRRIRLHTTVDDATLFEMEEIGILYENEDVVALYKDFESLNEATEGSTVFIVTEHDFVVAIKEADSQFYHYHISLNSIDGVQILSTGKTNEGLLMSLAHGDEQSNYYIRGDSYMDSPEVFVHGFLNALDDALLEDEYDEYDDYDEDQDSEDDFSELTSQPGFETDHAQPTAINSTSATPAFKIQSPTGNQTPLAKPNTMNAEQGKQLDLFPESKASTPRTPATSGKRHLDL